MDLDEVIAFTGRHGENAAAIGRGSPPAHLDGRPFSRIAVGPIATSPELLLGGFAVGLVVTLVAPFADPAPGPGEPAGGAAPGDGGRRAR